MPPALVASPGDPGPVQVEAVAIETFEAEFDPSYLQLVVALAAQDRVAGDVARAQERENWLARVSTPQAG